VRATKTLSRIWTGLASAILGVALLGAGSMATVSHPTRADEDVVLLRELAERLLAPPMMYGPSSELESLIKLLPGQLPDDYLLAIPTPPGGRLIGTLLRGYGEASPDALSATVIVFMANGSSEETFSHFSRALEGLGWRLSPGSPRVGGPTMTASFCRTAEVDYLSPSSPEVQLNLVTLSDGEKDVRLMMDWGAPCPDD
jgi:hypothetical protein